MNFIELFPGSGRDFFRFLFLISLPPTLYDYMQKNFWRIVQVSSIAVELAKQFCGPSSILSRCFNQGGKKWCLGTPKKSHSSEFYWYTISKIRELDWIITKWVKDPQKWTNMLKQFPWLPLFWLSLPFFAVSLESLRLR